ncbi:MAG: hypothetical protein U0235_14315 [Polyangiaceae bacterium]
MDAPGLKVVTRDDADLFDEVILARLPGLLAQCKVAREKKGLVIDDLVAIIVARTHAGEMVIDEDRTGVIPRAEAADFFDRANGYAGFGAFLRDRSRPGFLAVVAEIDGSVTGRFVRPLSLESRGDA